MTSLCLDTTVIVDVLRGRESKVIENWAKALQAGAPLVVSLVTYHELVFGAEVSLAPSRQHEAVDEALRAVSIIALDEADMLEAARLRAALMRRGRRLGPFDLLIGAQARARGWTLVTSNVREFDRIDGLRVTDWRVDATEVTTG